MELDRQTRPRRQERREAPGTPSRHAFLAAERTRQPYHENLDVFRAGQRRQRLHRAAWVPAVHVGARMGQEAEFIRYSNPDAHLADIDAESSHGGWR